MLLHGGNILCWTHDAPKLIAAAIYDERKAPGRAAFTHFRPRQSIVHRLPFSIFPSLSLPYYLFIPTNQPMVNCAGGISKGVKPKVAFFFERVYL